MRIAQVCPYSLSEPGGVQAQVFGLARALIRLGHLVTVVGPNDAPIQEGEWQLGSRQPLIAGVPVVAVGTSTAVEANGSIAPIAITAASARLTVQALRDHQFDVLHLHEPLVPGPTVTALMSANVPIVGTFHLSGTSASYDHLGPLVRRWARRLAVRCAVSDEARATAEKSLGGSYEVLFNGVDIDRFASRGRAVRTASEPASVVFVGRHESRKGLRVLLDAFRALRLEPSGPGRRAVLRIAGEGPETAPLQEGAKGIGGIEWLGRVDDAAVVSLLRGADLVCAPSLGGESFGIVLVEAMAAGAPVVASDISGYRQVAGDDAAVLVPPGDPAALAAALARVLSEPSLADSLVEAGIRRARAFSMGTLAAEYSKIYLSLCSG